MSNDYKLGDRVRYIGPKREWVKGPPLEPGTVGTINQLVPWMGFDPGDGRTCPIAEFDGRHDGMLAAEPV